MLLVDGDPTGTSQPRDEALACVRDDDVWSELVPVGEPAPPMTFRIYAFHFDPAYDATGFVGWLHAHLARATGAGHIVVCGRSAGAGADHVPTVRCRSAGPRRGRRRR